MTTLTSLLERKTGAWIAEEKNQSASLTGAILRHIEADGFIRLPQRQAISTYLWWKFVGGGRQLSEIIGEGLLSDEEQLRERGLHTFATGAPVAQFLALFAEENGARNLSDKLLRDPQGHETPWDAVLKDLLGNFSYPNATWSLPMGAGKTYLMASFIYLDLYFSRLFPDDPRWARNFVVFAPAASKTAILPSLQTIRDFDPGHILPREEATRLRRDAHIEILDALASDRRDKLHGSNPNLEKVNRVMQTRDWGAVFITNAEKVVLERLDATAKKNLKGQKALEDMEEVRGFNLLRETLSKVPALGIMLDEVHHAANDEKKLRQAVGILNQHGNVRSVLGLTGTPYVDHEIKIGADKLKLNQISDVLYSYSLADGIGKFLKVPEVRADEVNEETFVANALTRFFADFDVTYPGGTKSKIAFYCPSVEVLNQDVLPAVSNWYATHRPGQNAEIFRFYSDVTKANKEKGYALPREARAQFHALDRPHSPFRIVLLVAVGTEGWDCKSLTAVALPRKASTSKNFVLQTTCRCLREVKNAGDERALIYLSPANYDLLDKELKDTYRLSVADIQKSGGPPRVKVLQRKVAGELRWKQVRTRYILVRKLARPTAERLSDFDFEVWQGARPFEVESVRSAQVGQSGLERARYESRPESQLSDGGTPCPFWRGFLSALSVSTFGVWSEERLGCELGTVLEAVYERVCQAWKWMSQHPDGAMLPVLLAELAALLGEENEYRSETFTSEQIVALHQWPDQDASLPLQQASGKMNLFMPEIKIEDLALMQKKYAEAELEERIQILDSQNVSFHYAPYLMDSALEQEALRELLALAEVKALEVVFNGYNEGGLPTFWIQTPSGKYTPDFLILRRDPAGKIARVLIIETKGATYAEAFKPKKAFVEGAFLQHNPDYDFLYCLDDKNRNSLAPHLPQIRAKIAALCAD